MTTTEILLLTLLLALILLALGLLVTGLAMLFHRPEAQTIDPTASTTRLADAWQTLNRQFRMERLLYHHHRITGLVVIAVALVFIFQGWRVGLFTRSEELTETWRILWWLLVAGNLLNLVVGLVILLRPSMLKPIEAWANRWFGLKLYGSGYLINLHPRLRGLIITLIGTVALVGLGMLLAEQLGWWTG